MFFCFTFSNSFRCETNHSTNQGVAGGQKLRVFSDFQRFGVVCSYFFSVFFRFCPAKNATNMA